MSQAKAKELPKSDVAEGEAWTPPQGLTRNGRLIVAALVVLFNVPLIHYYVFRGEAEATVSVPFEDDFSNPDTVAKNYSSIGGYWRVENGWLLSPGVKNNPLWLKARLPQNVAIEFDAKSHSPEGDIKMEIFGDGIDHASGYVLIFGGWNNSLSIIARLDEHGRPLAELERDAQNEAKARNLPNANLVETGVFNAKTRMRVEANPFPVQIGMTYHWRVERRGSLITWFINGQKFMEFNDPIPLVGKGHDRFGFSSWEAQLYFDNLRIEAL